MKKWTKLSMVTALTIAILAGCGAQGETAKEDTISLNETASIEEITSIDVAGLHHVNINIENYGTISVELNGDVAPITVANFLQLADKGFYDGLTFHRIIKGFMMQGGASLGNEAGGSVESIVGEFAQNGIENPLLHTRGAISMARSTGMDTASSQFFIVHEDSPHLNELYACFGYVTEGMEIVDAICEDTKVEDDNGTVAKENQPRIESIVVVD